MLVLSLASQKVGPRHERLLEPFVRTAPAKSWSRSAPDERLLEPFSGERLQPTPCHWTGAGPVNALLNTSPSSRLQCMMMYMTEYAIHDDVYDVFFQFPGQQTKQVTAVIQVLGVR